MKIISWNCNMAFRKKWPKILEQQPDILVIQECEHPEKFNQAQQVPDSTNFLWFGENKNKGLAVITFNNYQVVEDPGYCSDFRYIVPVKLRKNGLEIQLFIIWAMPEPHSTVNSYVGQIWNALKHYESNLSSNSIWVGDWNSNAIWDHQRKKGNHSMIVEQLNKMNIVSLYHFLKKEPQGQEKEPTLYLLKQKGKPFHLDFCFAPERGINKKTTIEVGKFEEWISLSDHMPLIIDGLEL